MYILINYLSKLVEDTLNAISRCVCVRVAKKKQTNKNVDVEFSWAKESERIRAQQRADSD